MRYNPFGYRFFSGTSNYDGDVFIYSSQGQLVAKYRIAGNTLKLDFLPIYEGSKRIGIVEPEGIEWEYCPGDWFCNLVVIDPCIIMVKGHPKPPCDISVKLRSERRYELTDHLGNVRVVIADQRVPVSTNGTTVAYYKPLVKSVHDYYPFGWVKFHMDYSFGANAGSLFEDWDSTKGTYYTLYRLLDSRIARWYQVEPRWEEYAMWSGYVVNMGNPVVAVDPFGRDTVWVSQSNGKMQKHVGAKGKDVFIIVNDSTQKEVARLELPENSLEKVRRVSGTFVDERINEHSDFIDIYRVRGDSNAQRLFEFLANNTPVEWSWWQTGAPKVGEVNFLITGGLHAKEPGAVYLYMTQLAYGYTLRMHVHSHPGDDPWVSVPSGYKEWVQSGGKEKVSDIGFASTIHEYMVQQKRSSPTFKIYVPRDRVYITYFDRGQVVYTPTVTLPSVEIKVNTKDSSGN